ncbi:PREDICTED: uncharacterized protein LOC104820951 isoform X2 [Tarenaya hassleriana]|uniref:uncharacterized protein LOC104820951 isoform X2 n=1 Tax=Tarenaya hassleriana TaxID=28532 RepID=UPI00053C5B48|nr:PREDICTED: uncharacterized protein LOC104820951 isoform X2 [Tarenaya hassleriana]
MADPSTGAPDDPYHDPYDGPFTEEELFNVISDLNPSLVDLSLSDPVVDVNPPPASMEAGNAHNPRELEAMTDPRGSDNDQTLSWMNIGQLGRENVGEGNKLGEGSTLEASSWEMSNDRSNCYEAGETSMPASVRRTSSEDVFVCSCCQLLREFIHTNGRYLSNDSRPIFPLSRKRPKPLFRKLRPTDHETRSSRKNRENLPRKSRGSTRRCNFRGVSVPYIPFQ